MSPNRVRKLVPCATGLALCSTVAGLTLNRVSGCGSDAKPLSVGPIARPTKKKCIIIGGGVAGVASAHELARLGVEVKVLEKSSSVSAECSAAPAGAIHRQSSSVGSEELQQAIRCFLSFGNEFKFAKIDWWKTLSDPHFLRWALLFCHNSLWLSDEIHEARRQNQLKYYDFSVDLLEDLLFQQYGGEVGRDMGCRRGALRPLRGQAALMKAQANPCWEPGACSEPAGSVLDRAQALLLEPWLAHVGPRGGGQMQREGNANTRDSNAVISAENGTDDDAISGAMYQPNALSANCQWFTRRLATICSRDLGVKFLCNTEVTGFDVFGGRITAIHTCAHGSIAVAEDTDVLVAAGSWTPMVMRKLELFAPVYPMKGYTICVDLSTTDPTSDISATRATRSESKSDRSGCGNGISASELPQRIVTLDSLYMSRFLNEVRITSMGEFSGYNTQPGEDVVESIKKQAINLFPSHSKVINAAPAMVGLRPLVFDNMLIAGKVSCLHNLYVNVGPSQTAWKGCLGSARVVAAALTGRSDLLPGTFDEGVFSPEGKIVNSPFFCQIADARFKYF